MPLTAQEFIDRLEFLGLLEEKVLANMRRQVAEAKNPISAQTLAKLLVDQGQLTPFQAKKLVGEESPPASPDAATTSAPSPSVPFPSTPSPTPEVSLPSPAPAPEQPIRSQPPPASVETTSPPPAKKNAPAAVDKTQNDELGLALPEDQLLVTSYAAHGKPAEAEEIVDLIAVPETPAPKAAPRPAPPSASPQAARPPAAAPPAFQAPPAALTPLDSSGGLTPLGPSGGLTPLSGSGQIPAHLTPSQPVDLFSDSLAGGAPGAGGQFGAGPYGQPGSAGPGTPGQTPSTPLKKPRGSQWDSPLLFVGGGGLVLLTIALVLLYWVLTRGSADKIFQLAEEEYRAQSYGAASAGYDKFLANFPKDSKASLARVRRGMCRLRPLVESKSWSQALVEANKVLPEIEVEAQFNEARAELATLLPDIAQGFATKARSEADTTKSQVFVEQAEQALKLVNNSAYIPTTLRTTTAVEPRILSIQEDVAIARRDINRDQELVKALAEIEAAVKARNTSEAYAIRKQLIKNYPDLEANAELHRSVLVITESERELVKSSFKSLEALTDDDPPRSEFRVVLAANSGAEVKGVEGRVLLVLARGAVYALDAPSGKVLWRRFVGFDTKTQPRWLSQQPDADVLLVDGRRHELLRVKSATGKLVWRLPLGEPFSGPVFGNDRIFLTTRAGKVIQVDPQNGNALREAAFPQMLNVEPGLDARGRVIFQVGEHSNIYVLKVDTLGCESVFYVGQKAGSVIVPPLFSQGYLFVAENAGADFCLLHVIAADTGDAGLKEAQEPLRLKGRVVVPLAMTGRRVLVVTDLGEIHLIEIDAANAKKPASSILTLGQTTKEPVLGYPLADEGGLLWVADRRVAKYEVQTSRGEFVRKSIKEEGETFVGPLERFGDAVLTLRRRRNSTGVTVSAVQVDSDQVVWQTELATPLAGPVQIDAAKNRLVAISTYAEFYGLEQSVLQAGLSGKPATVIGANIPGLTFGHMLDQENGRLVLVSNDDDQRAITYDPNSEAPTRMVKLAFPANSAVGGPVLFRGGLLRPSKDGRVYLLDPKSGGNLMLPFQPRLAVGESVSFSKPAVLSPEKIEFVVADSRKRLYRVGVKDQPEVHLEELAQVETTAEIVSPLAAAGDTLYAVTRLGTVDSLISFHLPDLKPGPETPLSSQVVWGPEAAGNVVFVATKNSGLLCLEAGEKERWKSPLPYGPLAGAPLAEGNDFILASLSGTIWRVAGSTGEELARLDLGEPLGAGPVAYGGRLLLAGSDGMLHIVRLPVSAAAKTP